MGSDLSQLESAIGLQVGEPHVNTAKVAKSTVCWPSANSASGLAGTPFLSKTHPSLSPKQGGASSASSAVGELVKGCLLAAQAPVAVRAHAALPSRFVWRVVRPVGYLTRTY